VAGETTHLRNKVQSVSDVSTVVLDLARVNRIDAGGLGVLLELREQSQGKGIEFKLMNVTKLVKQVLEITRLDSVFEISSEHELAAAGVGSAAGVLFVRCSKNEDRELGF
jgi:anti-sigma B factor antagonist